MISPPFLFLFCILPPLFFHIYQHGIHRVGRSVWLGCHLIYKACFVSFSSPRCILYNLSNQTHCSPSFSLFFFFVFFCFLSICMDILEWER